jgi:hypothetical protein
LLQASISSAIRGREPETEAKSEKGRKMNKG